MTKHTIKALNTLLIFAILCAFCITPAAAAPTKIATDTSANEVVIDDFHTKIINFTLNSKWSDSTLKPFFKYCALDEKCWSNLTPEIRDRLDNSYSNKLINHKLEKKLGLTPLNQVNQVNLNELKAKLANQGWLDKDVYSSGTLKLSYKNNFNGDNKITLKALFTPKTIITYNHKFHIDATDQKEISLIDKQFDLSTDLSTIDRNNIEFLTKIIDKQSSVNDIALLIEGGVLITSAGTTIITCLNIPTSAGVSTYPCILSIGSVFASSAFLMANVKLNVDIKNQVAQNLEEFDFSIIQMRDEL